MGYLDHVALHEHVDWPSFVAHVDRVGAAQIFAMWDEGATDIGSVRFAVDDYVVFGQESVGLPEQITSAYPTVRIPMPGIGTVERTDHRAHSLNVSVCVGIVVQRSLAG